MKKIILVAILLLSSQLLSRDITAHLTKSAVAIDGVVAANEWPPEIFQSGFVQMEPERGQSPREKTSVAVMYDDKNLYLAFICFKSYPDPVVAKETRRDQLEKQDDVVAIVLDTYHDARSAFWFMTNCLNTQVDARIGDNGNSIDTMWDTDWKAKTALFDSGYSVEFVIPFKSLRFDPSLASWGINFGRFIPKWLETSYWAGATDSDFRVSNFGQLTGLKFAKPTSEFHFIPYATLRQNTFFNPHRDGMEGLDLEYRFKNNLTANVTINPDFATVEGDREKINLSRWELSFPEKRNFFLESSELFDNRIQAFYSRRIGEINVAGKVMGKSGKNTFAVIGVNAKPVSDNPQTSSDESFPEFNQGIIRLKRDVLNSSTIGMMYIEKDWENGYNRLLSLDGVFHLPHEFHLTAQWVAAAPGKLKESSGGFFRLARENNIYHYHLRYTELGENFQTAANALGYIPDDNRRELDSAVEYKWWFKKSGLEFLEYESNYNIYWAKSNSTLRSWQIVQEAKLYFTNKLSIGVDMVREYELFEKNFHNYDAKLELGYNTEEWSSSAISYGTGKNYDRNYRILAAEKNFKLSEKFSVEYELQHLTFDPDPEAESTWLNIALLNYQFTPDLFLRLFSQHRSSNNRIYIYSVFGWRFKLPSSAIYVVYTRDDFDRLGLSREQTEILFLKLAYDFSF